MIYVFSNQHIQQILNTMEELYWIGIRRQDKSVWERRTPLAPTDVKQILTIHPHIRILVQPSQKRIFSNHQYEQAGALLEQDLSRCSVILGIKEVPIENMIPDKTFIYFSHTIKAQLHNMPALDALLNKNIRLIDYERITDDKNNRLIAFGKYAGMAGAIDFLKGFGQFVMQMGISTPFLHCNCSYKYFNLEDCFAHHSLISAKIKQKQIPKELSPMIFAITGRGRTAQGCAEILQNFPITKISPKEIANIWADKDNPIHRSTIYLVHINTQDCIEPLDPNSVFDKDDYYKNPGKYRCNFSKKYLPYITALFHCIFWSPAFPKYIQNKDLIELAEQKRLRLLGICDITCDLQGSIECLQEYTQPERPFFYYDAIQDKNTFDASYKYGKVLYLAIDFLPCELAYDASYFFSQKLKGWIDNIVRSNPNKDLDEQGLLPELKRAVITNKGKLTPNYQYIIQLREQNMNKSLASKKKLSLSLQFDKSNSILQHNVTVVTDIQGEALDFTQ